ncbi:MAG TPA: hypothetical protein VE687_13765 [Stellaceae bacterium]|nr:hypothetical protein [Stellaceae bacterium]
MAEKEQGGAFLVAEAGAGRSEGGGNAGTAIARQATEALERFRSVIDQASQALRDLAQATGEWAPSTDRAREVAQGLRSQGEQYVGTVSRQVEQNPMASIAIAFALGCLLAAIVTRR